MSLLHQHTDGTAVPDGEKVPNEPGKLSAGFLQNSVHALLGSLWNLARVVNNEEAFVDEYQLKTITADTENYVEVTPVFGKYDEVIRSILITGPPGGIAGIELGQRHFTVTVPPSGVLHIGPIAMVLTRSDKRKLTVISYPGTPNQNSGVYTSPPAFKSIVSVTLQPGDYYLSGASYLSGTTAAADENNIELRNVTNSTSPLTPLPLLTDGNPAPWGPVEIQLSEVTTFEVRTLRAGTTGAIYTALISAVPVPGKDAYNGSSSWNMELMGHALMGIRRQ